MGIRPSQLMYDDILDPTLHCFDACTTICRLSALAIDQSVGMVVGKAKSRGPGSYLAVPYMIAHSPNQLMLYFG